MEMVLLAALACFLVPQEEDIAALLRLLKSKDAVISSHAEETLVELGPRVIPDLEREDKGADAGLRPRLQRMIKEIREFEAGLESQDFDNLNVLLARLDERALHLQRRFSRKTRKPARVAAVLDRAHADKLGARNAYALSTYSFEFETRDAVKVVRNDWDFCFASGRLRVRTVTDDRSEIWEMGKEFDALQVDGVRGKRVDDMPQVGKGKVYVVHTDDSDSNFWTKLEVLEQRPDQWILFRWERIADVEALLKLERTPERLLKSGTIRLQIRAGHGGGNPMQLHADGGKNGYLSRLSTKPLDMDAVDARGDSLGYVEGGLIPVGKVWVLRRARLQAKWGESGRFHVSVKGTILGSSDKLMGSLDEMWKGRLVVRPGEERSVWVQAAYFTQCDIELFGALWDEKFADVEVFPELKGEDKVKAERLVNDLDSDEVAVREQSSRDLVNWGPPVLGHLQRIDGSKKSAEFRARLKEIILGLGGEWQDEKK